MKLNEALRQVSEGALPVGEDKVFPHARSEPMIENGTLSAVLTHKYTGPRDVMTGIDWSLDSRKIAWALFQQSNAEVRVLIAEVGAEKKGTTKREPAKPAKVVHRFTHTGGP